MKKWLWYFGVIAAVAALSTKPSAGDDIGKLQPVQVVCLSRSDGAVVLRTDTGDWGSGETVQAAVESMKSSAASEIFLETADYLLVAPECMNLLNDAMKLLRSSCSICLMEGEPDMENIGQFLQIHAPEVTLIHYRAGERDLQTLKSEDGRMSLVP